MKKISTLFAVIAIALFACQSPGDKNKAAFDKTSDSLKAVMDSMKKAHFIDSTTKAMTDSIDKKALFDTAGLYMAPVKVLSSKIVSSASGQYRNVQLSYKNLTKKAISAIRFKWYGLDAFGEPADMGSSFAAGFGGGYTDEGLAAGDEESGTWDILSRNAKKITFAWAYEVVFEDGSKWELGK